MLVLCWQQLEPIVKRLLTTDGWPVWVKRVKIFAWVNLHSTLKLNLEFVQLHSGWDWSACTCTRLHGAHFRGFGPARDRVILRAFTCALLSHLQASHTHLNSVMAELIDKAHATRRVKLPSDLTSYAIVSLSSYPLTFFSGAWFFIVKRGANCFSLKS